MTKPFLSGLGTALITPFKDDLSVDYSTLKQIVHMQLNAHVDFLVVLGTTAESVTLSDEEKYTICQAIIETCQSHPQPVPLVLGLGGNNTTAILKQLQEQKNLLRHFHAILSVCPYYNKPSQEGLFQHFSAIAKASPIPVILYNVPGRTGVNLLPETVQRLHEALPEKISGIKEASGNISQIEELIRRMTPYPNFTILSGDDGLAATLMDKGANGLISVASNAYPEEFDQLVRNHDHTLQSKFNEMINLLFKEGNPSGIKTLLHQRGYISNTLRLPLVPNSPTVQQLIQRERQKVETAK